MPSLPKEESQPQSTFAPLIQFPFPPVSKKNIRHCGFDWWYPRLRSHTPKARLIPLTTPFIDYLRADGIVLPSNDSEGNDHVTTEADDSGFSSASDSDEQEDDPAAGWRDIHAKVREVIAELGGKVTPKLNWSAPKDATWISPTNDMECRTPDDVYLLLKSSDFITHDLEHAFDDCVDDNANDNIDGTDPPFTYHLILRKSFNLNPSLEFRCFVRDRRLVAICQRDLNHFEFLFPMRRNLSSTIQSFLSGELLPRFGEEEDDRNFVFDVYVPPPHERVWLIDINPWALRTDPLLFSWRELLEMPTPIQTLQGGGRRIDSTVGEDAEEDDEEAAESEPIFRLVGRDDPEAYQFNSTRYSAHKLPKDVVDASRSPGEIDARELLDQWRKVMEGQNGLEEDEGSESS